RSSRALYDAAPSSSTDVTRAPLIVNRREIPPVLELRGDTSKGQPLTLAAAPAPAPVANVPHVAPATLPGQPRDTSPSTPKTMFSDAQPPVGAQQTFTQPDRVRSVIDTSRGTPKTLTEDAQAPVGRSTITSAPALPRIGGDTSQSAWPVLQAVITPAPFV